jgi:chitin synthase
MNHLELEMFHQIKNVIGVNPTFYEYLFMVDADTTVDPYSVNRLISAYVTSFFVFLRDDVAEFLMQHDT